MNLEKTKTAIILMCNMQEKLNNKTFPTWKSANLDWKLAMMLETAEMIESTPWKWWKHGNPDIENIKVELIDIFHFFISYNITAQQNPSIIANALSTYLDHAYKTSMEIDITKEAKEFLIRTANDNVQEMYKQLSILITYLFPNFEDFARGYLVKNILNTFRQDNGYKDGTYKKMWNGEEDNVVAFRLANEIDLTESFENTLVSELNNVYRDLG